MQSGNVVDSTATAVRRPSWIADTHLPAAATGHGGFNAGRRFSTGIGGSGNMSVASGAANKYTNTEFEDQEARSNNENMRRLSIASMSQRRESLGSVMGSGGGSSRRASIASMKDYLMRRRASKA
ncbi:hypothetical protein Z517_02071 [Fonsecaea pedrosoi CBS 271.37]|uniref:Unplaced genomic scaffold supercont1.2, whole genome shotgun sequence n=1 Tax=Fonsecaea pedrosoi CBS 271.37 TaxID=1442368 RepID=A0A0D2GPD0_9EURO|nr:uncharacterized protein Z517_02071 [Fonsecaea pedrosoi CBS 271.37]KIW82828.1 hypothetical protein Z517_02071 [Fonsecaea pedrosoi CBS 271.37]